jgi:hypothetical protein
VKDNIESPEESADNPSLQTSDESSSIPTLEAKAEGTPMFHAATFGQKISDKMLITSLEQCYLRKTTSNIPTTFLVAKRTL